MTIKESIQDIYRSLEAIDGITPDDLRNHTTTLHYNLADMENIIQDNLRQVRGKVKGGNFFPQQRMCKT